MGADQSSTQFGRSVSVGEDAAADANSTNAEPSKSAAPTANDTSMLKKQLSRMGSLIVVNPGERRRSEVDGDETMVRLDGIPEFGPIVRGREKIGWSKEGEELRRRLDPSPLIRIGLSFQQRLLQSTKDVASKQIQLEAQVRELEKSTAGLVKGMTERQKRFAKHAERLNKLAEASRSLSKCQTILNQSMATISALNALLPPGEQLEPFSWAEDVELIQLTK